MKLYTLFFLLGLATLQGCAPLLIAGAGTAAVASNDRRTLGAQLDDQTIEMKLGSFLKADDVLKSETHVNVTSMNGIVLLSGEAATAELRDRILAKTREVAGIRRTVNEIRVAPPAGVGSRGHDTILTGRVKARLVNTENVDSSHIKVITENNTVYLMGLMPQAEAQLAAESARTVSGVERVVMLFEYTD